MLRCFAWHGVVTGRQTSQVLRAEESEYPRDIILHLSFYVQAVLCEL